VPQTQGRPSSELCTLCYVANRASDEDQLLSDIPGGLRMDPTEATVLLLGVHGEEWELAPCADMNSKVM
jgi:hypothetical protein